VIRFGQAEDGESPKRQAAGIRACCEAKGLSEPELIADKGLSGFKSNSEGFQRGALCESKQIATVIVYDLRRLSRSVRDEFEFSEETINKTGIEFVSLLNDIDTIAPTEKAFLGITAIFNQLYRDEIACKTKEALSHERGKQEMTGGTVPLGLSPWTGRSPSEASFTVTVFSPPSTGDTARLCLMWGSGPSLAHPAPHPGNYPLANPNIRVEPRAGSAGRCASMDTRHRFWLTAT
jgi:DNA invertase Pin-like site-specific DNA recombinase